MRTTTTLLALAGGAVVGGALLAREAGRFSFQGKRVLVTGGSRGLGLVLARELAARGARLVLLAREEDTLERARSELSARGAEVVTVACDGGDPELVDRIRAVLPSMRQRGRGRIVNVSSIGAIVAIPHLVPYSASKFALRGLSEGLRAELAQDGIVVTTVCPGLMRTGSPRNVVVKGDHRAEYAWFKLSDAMPGLSMNAVRAARRILRACERGEGHVVLTFAAKIGALVEGIVPGLVGRLLGAVARVLPQDRTPASWFGWESESTVTRSRIGLLSDRAAERNNEIPAPEVARPAPRA